MRDHYENPMDGDCYRGKHPEIKPPPGCVLIYNLDEDETYVVAKDSMEPMPKSMVLLSPE